MFRVSSWRPGCRIAVYSAVLMFVGVLAGFDDVSASERSQWSFAIKAGRFTPDLDEWDEFYSGDHTEYLAVGLGYKLSRRWEVAMELGYSEEQGTGVLELDNVPGGEVTYTLVPVHVYLMWRGVYSGNQWLVPLAGAGFTSAYYNQDVVNQSDREGTAEGYNMRLGLQVLLDRADVMAAHHLERNFGVENTYLSLEYQHFSAKEDDIDVGGDVYLLGLYFEF